MKIEIKSKLSGEVIFECELEKEWDSYAVNLGVAIRLALKSIADLSGADLSGAFLASANLNGADLRDVDLRGVNFRDAKLCGADLSGADLRDACLRDADLTGAFLLDTDLRGADLSGAFLLDAHLGDLPDCLRIRNIHQNSYDAVRNCQIAKQLDREDLVIKLAGVAGEALEYAYGSAAAAALIYMKSDPTLERIPNLYRLNEDSLEDLKRLAENEPFDER